MDNFEHGRKGESILEQAFSSQLIQNDGWSVMESSFNSSLPPAKANKINQLNGDYRFFNSDTSLECFIDAKNGNWISSRSLNNLRLDAYVAFNMYYYSNPPNQFIVKLDVNLRSWIKSNIEETTRTTGDTGYSILWRDLPEKTELLEFDVKGVNNLIKMAMIEEGTLMP